MDQTWSRILRIVVFALLFVSTLTGLFLSDRLWTLWDLGSLPLWAAVAPPVMFFLFMVVFAIDRLHAVRRGSLPVHRAMFHMGASVLFFLLLLPHPSKTAARPRALRPNAEAPALQDPDAAAFLLNHEQETVRRAACSLLGQTLQDGVRPQDGELLALMAQHGENDASQAVREECQEAVRQLTEGAASHGILSWPQGPLFGGPDPGYHEEMCPESNDDSPEQSGDAEPVEL